MIGMLGLPSPPPHRPNSPGSRWRRSLLPLLLPAMAVDAASLNVMMVGNSYTGPVVPMVRSLLEEARSVNSTSSVLPVTAGGAKLAGWATNGRVESALSDGGLDFVVLQDQSQVAGFHGIDSDFRETRVDPVVKLDSLVRENGAQTVLYMTWGRERGDPNNWFYPDFKTMNRRLRDGYVIYRDAISTPERPVAIAPVGLAFEEVYDAVVAEGGDPTGPTENQFSRLYRGDGSHASSAGSYLAACVLVQTMTGEDPRQWTWKPNGVSEEERDSMQEFAWRAVQGFAVEQHTRRPRPSPTRVATAAPTQMPTQQPTESPEETATIMPTDDPLAPPGAAGVPADGTTGSPAQDQSAETANIEQPTESPRDNTPTSNPVAPPKIVVTLADGSTGRPAQDESVDIETDTPQSGESGRERRVLLHAGVLLQMLLIII